MEFSELLRQYIDKSSYNHMQFAKMCGIDRSMLQKILKGERKPQSIQQVLTFAERLMMSENEKEKLLEAYEILVYGKTVYYQRKSVHRFFETFSDLSENECLENKQISEKSIPIKHDIQVLSGKINITGYFQKLLARESKKEQCNIKLLISNFDFEMFVYIRNLWRNSNVNIQQIICLNQMREECTENNVNILNALQPLLFGTCNYELKYFYGVQKQNIAYEKSFCNWIFINDYCLMADGNYEAMMIYQKTDINQLYHKQFSYIWIHSKKFIQRETALNHYLKLFDSEEYIGIQDEICFYMGCTSELLCKNAEYDVKIKNYLDLCIKKINKKVSDKKRTIFKLLLTESCCIKFIEEGFYTYINLLEKESRCQIMKNICSNIREGLLDIRIIKEDYLTINHYICVNLISQKYVYLKDFNNGGYIVIEEQSIVEAFYDYFNYYMTSEKVYSTEESILIL